MRRARNQTSNCNRSFHVCVALFILASTVAPSSQFRVCEPYVDRGGRSHYGFHCPRLSDNNRVLLFCCHRNDTAFKYCCNETEFRGVTRVNATDHHTPNGYTAAIGVCVYGFLVLALILVDFLYYTAVNCELCAVYLARWGLGGRWLKQVQSQRRPLQRGAPPAAALRRAMALKSLVCSGCLDPRCHHQQQQQQEEHKLGPGPVDRRRPDA